MTQVVLFCLDGSNVYVLLFWCQLLLLESERESKVSALFFSETAIAVGLIVRAIRV